MDHRKRSPRVNASEKVVEQEHLARQPHVPASQKQLSQRRFVGETPLTGEDRPLDQPGGKRKAYDPAASAEHAATGHPDMRSQGPTTMPTLSSGRRKTEPARRRERNAEAD